MSARDLMVVVLLVALWGFNFVFIRIGLDGIPPILLGALRFTLCALPGVFFLPRPKCSWLLLAAYGLVLYAFQFGLLFTAMKVGMSAGLASLLMQTQAFFTIAMAAWIFKERPSSWKILGTIVAFSGIVVVAMHTQGEVTGLGLFLTLLGAFSWGLGNIITRKIGPTNPIALVVWGSLTASPFLIIYSLMVEGPGTVTYALSHMSMKTFWAVFYIVYLSTHLAYSLWNLLLNKYPSSTVAPFSLLVPVFGFVGAWLFLGESFPLWKLCAAALVILGLSINVFGQRIYSRIV
jgi:O-acetylserine/cysteine efflux transporter